MKNDDYRFIVTFKTERARDLFGSFVDLLLNPRYVVQPTTVMRSQWDIETNSSIYTGERFPALEFVTKKYKLAKIMLKYCNGVKFYREINLREELKFYMNIGWY